MEKTSNDATQSVQRREVRPGLTMVKREERKDDGRYLLYYDFERSGSEPGAGGNPSKAVADTGENGS